MEFSVDAADFLRGVDRFARQALPKVEIDAVNWTAYDALNAVKDRMRVTFDRPTPFAVNAFFVWRATSANRVATIRRKDKQAGRHFLEVQETGGPRPQTSLEKLLETKIPTSTILRSVIAATGGSFEAARLDAYGNWSRGERNQVLSALSAQRDTAANETEASRTRGRRRGRARYFVPKHGLAPGVYKRQNPDDIAVRVLKFSSKAPVYKPALKFESVVAGAYRDRLEPNLRRAFARALKASQ